MSEKDIKTKPQTTTKSVKNTPKSVEHSAKTAIKDIKTVAKDTLVKKVIDKQADARQNSEPQRAEVEATEQVENTYYSAADTVYQKGKSFAETKLKEQRQKVKIKENADIPKAPQDSVSEVQNTPKQADNTPKTKESVQTADNSAQPTNTQKSTVKTKEAYIAPYFEEKGITLGELTSEDIQDFYDIQLERVTANTVIHYHAIIRLALCYARKMGYIKENPIEEVDKPEKNQFVGKFYNSEELTEVIRLTKGTKLELPVVFGGFYGLRRSEIVGLRWSAIDFDNNVFYVNHTITTPNIDGKKTIVAKDRAKTKSSLRALPLDKDLKNRLLEIKKQQEQYQKKFKRSYQKKWLDYVMVDELGELILPDYITPAWKRLLEKNNMRVIRFHDLRHTCASLLLNKGKHDGITLKDIQVWLGHSDFSTTANTYSHLDATSKVSSLSALSGAVSLSGC